MRVATGLALIFVSGVAAAQQAPFCVVSQHGQTQCHYHSLDMCRQAAQSFNGVCMVRTEAQQQRQPNAFEAMAAGQESAARVRESRARTQLLEAQAKSISEKRQQTNDGYWVMYKCPTSSGEMELTGTPAPGCVVDSVTAY